MLLLPPLSLSPFPTHPRTSTFATRLSGGKPNTGREKDRRLPRARGPAQMRRRLPPPRPLSSSLAMGSSTIPPSSKTLHPPPSSSLLGKRHSPRRTISSLPLLPESLLPSLPRQPPRIPSFLPIPTTPSSNPNATDSSNNPSLLPSTSTTARNPLGKLNRFPSSLQPCSRLAPSLTRPLPGIRPREPEDTTKSSTLWM